MGGAFSFPFLSPAWLGLSLVASLGLAGILPGAWRRGWVLALGGCAVASLLALCGVIPWVGELHLTAYAIAMLGAFVVAYVVALHRARRIGIPERQLIDLFMLGLVGGVVGARAKEVMEHWDEFTRLPDGHPRPWGDVLSRAADIDGGGMVWYGGALLAAALMIVYLRGRRIPILAFGDVIVPAMLAGLAIGRLGCFFNGCCFGRPCTLPWAMELPGHPGEHLHPTQLYETLACLALAGATFWWWGRRRSDGEVMLGGILGYAIWRFGNEALRGDTIPTTLFGIPMSTSQLISIWLVAGGLALAGAVVWRRRSDPALLELATRVPGSRHALESESGSGRPPRTAG